MSKARIAAIVLISLLTLNACGGFDRSNATFITKDNVAIELPPKADTLLYRGDFEDKTVIAAGRISEFLDIPINEILTAITEYDILVRYLDRDVVDCGSVGYRQGCAWHNGLIEIGLGSEIYVDTTAMMDIYDHEISHIILVILDVDSVQHHKIFDMIGVPY